MVPIGADGPASDTATALRDPMCAPCPKASKIELGMGRRPDHRVPLETAFPGLSLGIAHQPAVADALSDGGDFWDAFAVSPDAGLVALVVGDMTGHGAEAAAYKTEVRYVLRGFLWEEPSPGDALRRLNQFLLRDGAIEGYDRVPLHAAVAVVVFDTHSGVVRCASAGSEPPLIVRGSGGSRAGRAAQSESIRTGGQLLGADAGFVFIEAVRHLSPGDMLALTTDGITEARRRRRRKRGSLLFGYERFRRAVKRAVADMPSGSVREMAMRIKDEAVAFSRGHKPDDMCLLLARRTAAPFRAGNEA